MKFFFLSLIISKVLKAKHWEEIEQVEEVKKQFTTAGAGIAGILKLK